MKKRIFSYAGKVLWVIFIVTMLMSCRNEICYDHFPTLDMGFEWEQEWERDYGNHHLGDWDAAYFFREYDDLRPDVPGWINLVQYTEGGETNETYLTPDGGRFHVALCDGSPILLYNGDTEYVIVSDLGSPDSAYATATSRSRSSLATVMERHPGTRTTNPPDILYAAYLEQGPVVNNHEVRQMAITMKPLVYTYMVIYEFESGVEHLAQARGALGGMAESVSLKTGTTSDETSVILFDCDIIPHGCKAEVRSFGVPSFPDEYYGRAATAAPKPYTLNLEIMLKSGKAFTFDYDVSDQIVNQPRGGVIKISGIKIEDGQEEEAGGFVVDVDEWQEYGQQIDIPIGGQKH